jgi:hypothetical protein
VEKHDHASEPTLHLMTATLLWLMRA